MNLRTLALGSAASMALLAGGAFAADLPVRSAAPAPVVMAPIFTWSGFYVGVNVGAGWRNDDCRGLNAYNNGVLVTTFGATTCVSGDNSDIAFTGGAQAGYNWQMGSFVLGVEADINAIGRGDRQAGEVVFPFNGANHPYDGTYLISYGRGGNYFGTARVRLGFAVDRALFYVTGGLAWGNSNDATIVDFYHNQVPPNLGANPTATLAFRDGSNNVGWALGAGLEYAFSNNWSMKLEYLHVDFGDSNRRVAACSGAYCTTDFTNVTFDIGKRRNDLDVVRVGLNYRFGGPSVGPVVARY